LIWVETEGGALNSSRLLLAPGRARRAPDSSWLVLAAPGSWDLLGKEIRMLLKTSE